MKKVMAALACTVSLIIGANASAQTEKPTVVLVHGAFADASSWNGVVKILEKDGYPVVAAANPLRSVKSDGAAVSALLDGIKSPVVLVGHSYGGNVISEAANDHANVKALVYVAAFAPEAGETVAGLAGKFPGVPSAQPSQRLSHWLMVARICTSSRTSFTISSPLTSPPRRRH